MSEFSVYPNAIDGYAQIPLTIDNVTKVDAVTVNRLRCAIINIEAELGVLPSGSFNTVGERLDSIDSPDLTDIEDRLSALEAEVASILEFIGGLDNMESDEVPTTILESTSIGIPMDPTLTDSISVRGFREIDFSFLVNNLGTGPITEVKVIVLYSILESPRPYATALEDWNILLAGEPVSGIVTADRHVNKIDPSAVLPSVPGSFAIKTPVAGLHMMAAIFAEVGDPASSDFTGFALRRI
jgi:hypothetical protein